MNRRQLIKSVIGAAVATAVPALPFVWREKTVSVLYYQGVPIYFDGNFRAPEEPELYLLRLPK